MCMYICIYDMYINLIRVRLEALYHFPRTYLPNLGDTKRIHQFGRQKRNAVSNQQLSGGKSHTIKRWSLRGLLLSPRPPLRIVLFYLLLLS
jgi:hypothetical protein